MKEHILNKGNRLNKPINLKLVDKITRHDTKHRTLSEKKRHQVGGRLRLVTQRTLVWLTPTIININGGKLNIFMPFIGTLLDFKIS